MSYKTELHCHTCDFVGIRSAENGAKKARTYIDAGYTTVVLTNHYRPYDPADHGEMVRRFFAAGEIMREAAGDRLTVITGMELKLRENGNDYLVFGMTEELLLGLPGIFDMTIGEFCTWATARGILVIQAHPFRVGSVPADPDLLDGAEIFNVCNPADVNKSAEAWAAEYADSHPDRRFILTSGSDHHKVSHRAAGGIVTESPITDMDELMGVLKSGEYELLRG